MEPTCLFCRIVAHEIPADIVYEDDAALAFRDIDPKAPVHVLVIPKTHHADLVALADDPAASLALISGIRATAAALGLTDFRTMVNTGAGVGQSVFHVHAHVLGGGPIRWP